MDLKNKELEKNVIKPVKPHPVEGKLMRFLKWLSKGQKDRIACKS
jgi:hypothetical protein